MAQGTFEEQVEGMTSLTIDSNTAPSQAELTNYLVDGVRDVANRILAIKPEEAALFSTTAELDDGNGTEVQSGMVIDVVRADGVSASNLIPADPITSSLRYRATDTDSLHYRSKLNPGYYVLNKKVYVVPVPDSGADIAKITYVDYDVGLVYNDTTAAIDNFPDKYQGLIVLYASCRSLLNAMGHAISTLSDYVTPVLSSTAGGGSAAADLTTMTDSNWNSLDFDFDDENIDVATWFQTAGDMIQRQEDIDLAAAQLEKIGTYINAYQVSVTGSAATFDKNLTKITTDYNWMASRYQALNNEYIGYFNALMGQRQAAQQAAQQQQEQSQARRG